MRRPTTGTGAKPIRGEKQENEKRFRQQAANLKRLFDAGLVIAAGTDAPYPGVFQGEGIHHEMELLVQAGLTPMQAITAATANAARLMEVRPGNGSGVPAARGRLGEPVS